MSRRTVRSFETIEMECDECGAWEMRTVPYGDSGFEDWSTVEIDLTEDMLRVGITDPALMKAKRHLCQECTAKRQAS